MGEMKAQFTLTTRSVTFFVAGFRIPSWDRPTVRPLTYVAARNHAPPILVAKNGTDLIKTASPAVGGHQLDGGLAMRLEIDAF
jgi:hypothetical protein